jgi:antitoxin component of MazEF toxin-antitoxin module
MESLDGDTNGIEFRMIQAIHGNSSFILVLPEDFVETLNIAKGDYVKCWIRNNQLIIVKADSRGENQVD